MSFHQLKQSQNRFLKKERKHKRKHKQNQNQHKKAKQQHTLKFTLGNVSKF